jgi:hypothetical protein
LSHFDAKNEVVQPFYQARIGTNVGKVEKDWRFLSETGGPDVPGECRSGAFMAIDLFSTKIITIIIIITAPIKLSSTQPR